jgi:hypothetical protein
VEVLTVARETRATEVEGKSETVPALDDVSVSGFADKPSRCVVEEFFEVSDLGECGIEGTRFGCQEVTVLA